VCRLNLKGILCACSITLSVCIASARSHTPVVRARVLFLATSTSVRSEYGESRDVYLVEVALPGNDSDTTLARLVDEFPPYRSPISPSILTASTGGVLRLWRDESCDIEFSRMILRTRPGDPRAILPERFRFRPMLTRAPEDRAILPCYRTFRH
jgi:hypothetical protein